MKKKIILIICLIIVLVVGLFVLTGCGNKKEESTTNDNAQSNQKNGDEKNNELTTNSATSNKASNEYDYKNGVLTTIVDENGNPKQTDFVIDGIILVGNRHEYAGLEADSREIVEKLIEQGYKKNEINSSFYLNEYINFYIDTKYTGLNSDVKILVTPHKTVEEYEKMSFEELTELAEEKGFVLDYKEPDVEDNKFVGENFVSMDYPEGKYDILFTYKGKLTYFINIDLTKETNE